jgi:putative hemolysin
LPGDAGFETLAGFLLFQLGYIPKPGDAVKYGNRKFSILAMDHNRIARVRVERLAEQGETADAAASKAGQPQIK